MTTDNHVMAPAANMDPYLAICLRGQAGRLAGGIDWHALADAAGYAGVSGLIVEALEGTSPTGGRSDVRIPDAARAALLQQASQAAARNLQLRRSLTPIIRAFNEAGVPLMLLKGAALNLTVYDRPDLRSMVDVDVMVRPRDVDRARAVLLEAGCRPGRDQVRDDFFPRYYYETEYTTDEPSPLRIDLHARLLRPPRYARTIPDDAPWADAVPVTLDGTRALVPSPENMLIHLASHAALHGGQRLRWLHDIKRFIESHPTAVDWPTLVRRAHDWRLSLPVRVGLERVEGLLGPTVPPEVLGELRRARVSLIDHLTLWHAPRDEKHPVGHVTVDLLSTPGLRYRLGYLAAMCLPGPRHMGSIYHRRHPGWLACAHVYRWIRAAARPLCSGLRLSPHR